MHPPAASPVGELLPPQRRLFVGGAGWLVDYFGLREEDMQATITDINVERTRRGAKPIAPTGPPPARLYTFMDVVPAVKRLVGDEVRRRRTVTKGGVVVASLSGHWGNGGARVSVVPMCSYPSSFPATSMPPALWDHQAEAIDAFLPDTGNTSDAGEDDGPAEDENLVVEGILKCPCGGGKTRFFAEVALGSGANVLYVAHSNENVCQMEALMLKLGAQGVHVLSGCTRLAHVRRSRYLLATYESLLNVCDGSVRELIHRLPFYPLVLVDEAHRLGAPSYKGILQWESLVKILATATDDRLDGEWREVERHFRFKHVVDSARLVREGIVAEVRRVEVHIDEREWLGASGLEESSRTTYWAGPRKMTYLLSLASSTLANVPGLIIAERRAAVDEIHRALLTLMPFGVVQAKVDGTVDAVQRRSTYARFRERVAQGLGAVIVACSCADEAIDIPCKYVLRVTELTHARPNRTQTEGRAARPGGEMPLAGRTELQKRRAYSLLSTYGGPSGRGELEFAEARRYEGETPLVLHAEEEVSPEGLALANAIEDRLSKEGQEAQAGSSRKRQRRG